MKVETLIFGFLFVFLGISDAVYGYYSHDPAGTTALALAAGLGLLISFYLRVTGKRLGDRLEDRPDADISEGAGVLAHFSPGSIWPPLMGLFIGIAVLGFVFGLWLTVIGAIGGSVAVGGLVFEHYLGLQAPHAQDVPN